MANYEKIRRESIRWQILLTLNNARPIGCYDKLVLSVIQAEYSDATTHEIRKELAYLAERQLLKIRREPDGLWHVELIRYGVDIVEYTIDCEPGIARPENYTNA